MNVQLDLLNNSLKHVYTYVPYTEIYYIDQEKPKEKTKNIGLGKPTNRKLYDEIKQKVYNENPKHSLFRSAQIVKEYKDKGGEYDDKTKPDMNIYKWFKQNWISLQDYYYNDDILPCGSSDTMSKYGDYPLCRPLKIAESLTKEQIKKMIDEKNKLKEKHLKTKKVLGTDKFNIKSTKSGMK
jgi:hypothetical protein